MSSYPRRKDINLWNRHKRHCQIGRVFDKRNPSYGWRRWNGWMWAPDPREPLRASQ